jgi:uroporphyrinogen decarboxylase
MTGKERFHALMRREPVDRLPIDFTATSEMEKKLADALSGGDATLLRQKLGVDFFRVFPMPAKGAKGEYYAHIFVDALGDGVFKDSWGVTWKRAAMECGDVFYDVMDFPLKDAETVEDVEEYPWPDPAKEWDFSGMAEEAARHPDLAIVSGTSAVFDDAWRMRGLDRFMMDLALNPALARALLRKSCDYWTRFARLILENVRVDMMCLSDDLGTQNGLFISREMVREFVMPLTRERTDLFKSFGARVFMHSCGGIFPIIPDIIEAGVEILNPIQPRAKGMDRGEIKKAFGNRLTFHGSIDQQKILIFGSKEDVARETRECIGILGKGGGYIISPSHALESDIPVENVSALYETAQEFAAQIF